MIPATLSRPGIAPRSDPAGDVASALHAGGGRTILTAGRRRAPPAVGAPRVRAARLRAVPAVVTGTDQRRFEAVPLPRSRPPARTRALPLGPAHRLRDGVTSDHRIPVPDGAVLLAHRAPPPNLGRAALLARHHLVGRRTGRALALPHARRLAYG